MKCTLAEKEAQLWTKVLALGAALLTLFLARQAARPRSTTYKHDANRFAITGP